MTLLVEAAIDLGPENDQHLSRLRRALILGTGFQLVLVEVSHPNLKEEVLRRLHLWSGNEGVPSLAFVRTRPGLDPVAALQGVVSGAVLVGIDDPFDVATEQTMTTLNWYRDQLPSLVSGPLVLIVSPDGLRQLFVHAPDLFASRSHTTRITTPRPVDLELRPWPSRRASLEEKAWLERMIAASAANPEGPLARGLPGWLIRLGEIEGREGGSWKQSFSRAEELAAGRRDILFMLELARARRALDEECYADAELHEGRAAEHVSDSLDTNQEWEATRGTLGWGAARRESGRVSHDAVFAELRVIRAERLLHIGEVEQAASVAESAVRSAHASGDLALVIAALGVMASVAEHRGDVLDATARFHELREVARVARDRAAELFALIHLAELAPEISGARQLYLQAQSIMQEEDHEARARACVGLAMHALQSGNPEDGGRVLSEVAPLAELRPKTRVRVLLARGAIATARSHHDAALVAYRMARDEQQQRAVPPSRQDARIAVLLGEAALRAGDVEVAGDAFQRAAEIASVLADAHLDAAARAGHRRTRIAMGELSVASPDDTNPGHASRESLVWTSAMHATSVATQPEKASELEGTGAANDSDLAALESAFITLDAPGDAPERLELLDRLARTYARLGRRRDAGLCYARVVWETPVPLAHVRLETWIASELGSSDAETVGVVLDRVLADKTPPLDDVRLVAAIAAHASESVAKDLPRVQRWLDDFDGELDARTLWLARLGLAGIAGGDPRGLAHTRDRIRVRLANGLSAEREMPSFLRLSRRSGMLGNANGEHLARALEDLAQRIIGTKRKRSSQEAPIAWTNAYIAFQLGHGFARIGKHERARELTANAIDALFRVGTDPVHKYLIGAFSARVEQAIAGVIPETPLPDSINAELASLDLLARYKVDRFREASRILEPFVRPDPFGVFQNRLKDGRRHEFAALSDINDPVARAGDIDKLVDVASVDTSERERLVVDILDVLLELNEAQAAPILARTWPLIAKINEARRAILYAKTLVVAGHFGRMELVPDLLKLLGIALRAVESVDLDRVLDHSLRALRRIGLRNEIAELVAEAEHAIPSAHPGALHARLAFAGGLAFLGDLARALPIFDEARAAVRDDFQTLGKRRKDGTWPMMPGALVRALELVRALALAYAQAPLAYALGEIAELAGHFRDITDNLSTNSHFCLSVVHFVESLVLGITSDNLALGETGRRFIEDDEHLIRRRLHRDLRTS